MHCLNGVWVEDSDFQPMGEAESYVSMPGEITIGLLVAHPFGPASDATLAIRAIDDGTPGGVITLAITDVIDRETDTRPAMRMDLLSNPRRPDADTGED